MLSLQHNEFEDEMMRAQREPKKDTGLVADVIFITHVMRPSQHWWTSQLYKIHTHPQSNSISRIPRSSTNQVC